ncbi:hypothetical protein E2C01_053647 [Portunus trituberculatus]|uniref:Uncharacterized protein n=1 Tax=Portunus trituberculatus TaxID=210409 RepID=A0A5B7GPX8_PORTR|nr:hypothetical protein [Portunus trituberculatus]
MAVAGCCGFSQDLLFHFQLPPAAGCQLTLPENTTPRRGGRDYRGEPPYSSLPRFAATPPPPQRLRAEVCFTTFH